MSTYVYVDGEGGDAAGGGRGGAGWGGRSMVKFKPLRPTPYTVHLLNPKPRLNPKP